MLKEIAWGPVSLFSRRSAKTRRARICALAMASFAESPYARTPGSCGTSASHRPSLSRSHSISKFMATPFYAAVFEMPNAVLNGRPPTVLPRPDAAHDDSRSVPTDG